MSRQAAPSQAAADPLFRRIDSPELTDAHLTSLAAGTLAAVRVPGFLSPADCARIVAQLNNVPLGTYDTVRVDPPIRKFGPILNDNRADGGVAPQYWGLVSAARIAWRRARLHPDPLAVSLNKIGAAWGRAVEPATIDGRRVFYGTLREINAGAHVHYDEAVREFPRGPFDQHVVAQLAFNLFLAIPSTGGETSVWRRNWEPSDEEHRNGYGYAPHVVDGAQHIILSPSAGDAVFFDPRHYHAVAPSSGGQRIAVAYFLAITSLGDLIAWS